MVRIRLERIGKRGHATYRIVAKERSRPPKSGAFAQLGWYDPHTNAVRVNAQKVENHLAHGAQLSPTVRNLLIEHKVIEGVKLRVWKPKKRAEREENAAPAPPERAGLSAGQEAPPEGSTPAAQ